MKVGHQLPHADQQRLHLGIVVDNNVDDLRSGHQKFLGHRLIEDLGLCYDIIWLADVGLELDKEAKGLTCLLVRLGPVGFFPGNLGVEDSLILLEPSDSVVPIRQVPQIRESAQCPIKVPEIRNPQNFRHILDDLP